MKKILFILLFLYSGSWGTTTTITSLPYTFDSNDMSATDTDTLVLQGTKLSSTTGGIRLAALSGNRLHDVVLNLGTDTLEFGTAGGDGNVGITIIGISSYYPYDIKVVGGYVLHTPSDTTADLNRCLTVTGNNILIKNVNAIVRGYNGKVLTGNGRYIYNDTIKGCTFRSEVSGFTSRCQYDASVVELTSLYKSTLDANGAEYHWVVDSLTINGGPHVGIHAAGYDYTSGEYATVKITNCDIMTDARNEFYLSDAGLCYSTSNPYGISYRNCAGGLIYNNTIISGTTYGGNRGILIERSDSSTASNPLIIRKNTVNVHEGPNVHYGDALPLHALRIRYGPGNIIIDSNTFIGSGDSDTGTKHTGTQVHTVRYTDGTTGVTNVQFSNNRVRANALDASVTDCNAIIYDAVTADTVYNLSYNNITSSGNIYKYGEYNGEALANLIIGDTVGFEDTTIADNFTYSLGYLSNNWDCSGNISRDGVYQNGTSDTNIQFSTGGTLDISLQRTLNITVNGNNSLPVPNAICTLWNNSGIVLNIDTSDANGLFSSIERYWFESRAGTDSTNIQPFDFRIWSGADSVAAYNWVMINESGSRDTTVVLNATVGVAIKNKKKYRGITIRGVK